MRFLSVKIEIGPDIMMESGLEIGISITDKLWIGLVYEFLQLFHIGFTAVAIVDYLHTIPLGKPILETEIRCPVDEVLLHQSTVHLLSEYEIGLVMTGIELDAITEIEFLGHMTHAEIEDMGGILVGCDIA